MSEREFDFVVFGATGYTGQYVAEEVAKIADKNPSIKFAVAGRNKEKLEKTLEKARSNTKLELKDVAIIVADVSDEASLLNMAKQTKVVINCVGPYRFHGEKVVMACIEGGANHVDISGEPQYLETMQLRHSKAAEEKGVHIVGACGFDSVPADMGTVFLQDSFPGDINSAEMVVGMDDTSVGDAPINFTTLECAVHGFTHSKELKSIRKELFQSSLPKSTYKPEKRGKLYFSEEANRWCLPNLASDRSVVMRSQRINFELEKRRPLQFSAYFGITSLFTAIFGIFFGLFFYLMVSFPFTRNLLLQYPECFTFGTFSRKGPKREDLKGMKFCVTITGHGWEKKLENAEEEHSEPPSVTKTIKVTGPDPGYFGTATIVTQCALTVLQEKEKLPGHGGVFPPGAAFLKTSLRTRLEDHGIQFKVQE